MVTEDRGTLYRRKDGKYMIYLPVPVAIDSMFPFKRFLRGKRGGESISVKVSFKIGDKRELIVEEWPEPEPQE